MRAEQQRANKRGLRVAEVSYLRWPNTEHLHKDFKKQTCRQQSDHFICSTPALSVLFFSIIACSVLMALVFYYNDMLQKVTIQRIQHFSVTPKRRPCRLQTADCRPCRPCRPCRLCRPCRPSTFFLILVFAFTFDSHIFSLWSQISVQLYFGVFVCEKAVLRDASLVCDC